MKDIHFVDKKIASYNTFSLDPTPDVPICPLVDNCSFNYYNVSVMHNCSMDFRRHLCVASTFSCFLLECQCWSTICSDRKDIVLQFSWLAMLYNVNFEERAKSPFSLSPHGCLSELLSLKPVILFYAITHTRIDMMTVYKRSSQTDLCISQSNCRLHKTIIR